MESRICIDFDPWVGIPQIANAVDVAQPIGAQTIGKIMEAPHIIDDEFVFGPEDPFCLVVDLPAGADDGED